jgi:hypothetical protein
MPNFETDRCQEFGFFGGLLSLRAAAHSIAANIEALDQHIFYSKRVAPNVPC